MPDQTIDSEDVLEILQTAAEGPQEVSSDAGMVRQFALTDLIAAHKYLAQVQAQQQSPRTSGLRFSRLIPDGTVQRDPRRCL